MTIHFNPSSWLRAGRGYEDTAPEVDGQLGSVIAGTTDPAACGSASGLATVDAAISIVLGTLGSVLSEVQKDVVQGLLAESGAMIDIGHDYAALEEENVATANTISGEW